MQTSTPVTEMTPANIYRDLTADELIASFVARANSSTAYHEEQLIPVIVDKPEEVRDPGAQVYHPSSNYFEQYPTHDNERNILDEADGKAGDQVVQTDLATNATGTPSKPTGARRGRPPGPRGHYKCPHCNVENIYLSLHEQHMVNHETAQLSCPTCGKVVKRKGDLARHMKVHVESWKCNGATDGPCGDDGCGAVFSRKDNMVRHWAKIKKIKENSG